MGKDDPKKAAKPPRVVKKQQQTIKIKTPPPGTRDHDKDEPPSHVTGQPRPKREN